MASEEAISLWEEVLAGLLEQAGSAENTRIDLNLTVVDASPAAPLTDYIIVSGGPGGSFNGPALKLPGYTYTNGDKVNVLIRKGTEPIAMQQGSGSTGTNSGRVSEVYDEGLTNIIIDIDASGNVAINAAQADRDLAISWDSGTALSIDGATGNVSIGTILIVNSVIQRVGDTDTHITMTDDKIAVTAGGVELLALIETAQDEVVVNDSSADVDFRVESDNRTAALFVQGSDGAVGIGTNAPSHQLHVVDTASNALFVQANGASAFGRLGTYADDSNITLSFQTFGGSFAGTTMGQNRADAHALVADGGPLMIGTDDAHALTLGTADTQRLQILSGGNVGVGPVSPTSTSGAYWQVRGAIGGAGYFEVSGVAGTAVVIIPDGTRDVTTICYVTQTLKSSAGGSDATPFNIANAGTKDIIIGATTWQYRVNADGSLDVRRTAGTATATITLTVVFQ